MQDVNFAIEVQENIKRQGSNKELKNKTIEYLHAMDQKYSYNFSWMGRPIIQFPQDMVAMQEIIWKVRPQLIIETGIARGGSLIFYASMLEMMQIDGEVVGIDIDIRKSNRVEIEKHPMYKHITMYEDSSVDAKLVNKIYDLAKDKERVLVCLDSNHTHDHVLEELKMYAPLVSVGSYCVVFDTVIEDMPQDAYPDRPWDKQNNPKTAVWEYLKNNDAFKVDTTIENKLLLTVAKGGYLLRIK